MQKNILHYSVLMALATASMAVQAKTDTAELTPVKVVGKTQSNSIDSTLFNTSSVSSNNLSNPSVTDIADAFAKQTSVTFDLDGDGSAKFPYVRGLGENYTDITIDGIRKPSYFNYGHNDNYNSGEFDSFEPDTLKQIDIIKGRNSPKQRGGALAGSINMRTYNPSDFVNAEKPYYVAFKSGYASKNRSWGNTLTGAFSNGVFSGMLIYTHRNGHELDNKGNDAEKSRNDIIDIKQDNILAKGEIGLDKGNIIVTGEHFSLRKHRISRYSGAPSADEPTKRTRFSIESNLENVLGFDSLKAQLSYQKNKNTYQDSSSLGNMNQDFVGVSIDGVKTIKTGSIENTILLGLGWERTKFDFIKTDMTTHKKERPVPITVRNTFYAYAKDNITFSSGFTISLGLRVENNRHTSKIDDIYKENLAYKLKSYLPEGNKTAILPSIGLMMPLSKSTKIFASYSHGQKSADDTNLQGFRHNAPWLPTGSFYVSPNPNLKDEKSRNVELGIVYEPSDRIMVKLNGFYTQYKNFIDLKSLRYKGETIYMPYNIKKVKTYGLEFDSRFAFNDNFSTRLGFTWMKASNKSENEDSTPMQFAVPFKAVVGLSYQQANKWGVDVNLELASKGVQMPKTKKPGKVTLRTSGYGVVDLTAWAKPVKGLTISAGVYNLFDKSYVLASDINGNIIKPADNLDPYTRPGRNFAINLKYEY